MDPRIKIVFGGIVGTSILLVGWLGYELHRDNVGYCANADAYDQLEPGMTEDQMVQFREGVPDCVVHVGRSRAVYFWPSRSHIITGGMPPCPAQVTSPAELPRKYASLQVLVDETGTIYAVAFEGEAFLKTTGLPKHRLEVLRELPAEYVR